MKVVKNIFFGIKIFFKCIYAFFAFLVTGIFLLETFSTLFSSVYRNWFNVSQVIVFVLLNLFLIFLMWYILFSKRNFFIKLLIFALLFCSLDLFKKIDLPQHRSHLFDSDYCLEDGDCEEGRKLILENDKVITLNKETCLEYGWKWYEKGKWCDVFSNNVYFRLKPSAYELNKEECLKDGYCWDSQRNFCESKEVHYCIDNKKECEDKNGTWDKFFKSCNK